MAFMENSLVRNSAMLANFNTEMQSSWNPRPFELGSVEGIRNAGMSSTHITELT